MTGVSVVANPSFTPPRMEVTCTVVPGDVMKTATLNRIVNGVSTPTLSQPAPGFDTQVVEDYLAPYGVPVSYEFITDYFNPVGTTLWDETWANLSAWTNGSGGAPDSTWSVSGGKLVFTADPFEHFIFRTITPGSYHVTIASMVVANGPGVTTTASVVFAPATQLPFGTRPILQLSVNSGGTITVQAAYPNGGPTVTTVTSISAASPIAIDFLGASISITGTGGTWTSQAYTTTDIRSIEIDVHSGTGSTFTVGEIKVSNYPAAPTHLDVTSAPATLSPSQAWMVHPGSPSLSVPISSSDRSASAVRNLGPISQASASTLHPILGQSLPIETRSGPRFGNTLQVSLKARTAAHEAALNGILADGTPLLFRFPPTYDAGFDEGFYSVGNVQHARMAQLKGNHLREFTLDLTQVQQPTLTVQNTGWSWAALAAAFPTWQAVAQAYNTWADVLTNNRKPGY